MDQTKVRLEKMRISGEDVISRVKEAVRESNNRRMILKTEQGTTVLDVSLMVGIAVTIGMVIFLPFVAALAVIVALLARWTLIIE